MASARPLGAIGLTKGKDIGGSTRVIALAWQSKSTGIEALSYD